MINTSTEYKLNLINNRRFTDKATINLLNNEIIEVDEKDIEKKGCKINGSVSGSMEFEIGSANINTNTLVLNNINGRYNDVDFTGAVVTPYIGMILSNSIEWIKKGVYTVDSAFYTKSTVILNSKDNMRKFEKPFSKVSISFPCTALQLLIATCNYCGVYLQTTTFTNSSFTISRRPDDEAITCREVVSWIAQLSGNFARCNTNGALELKWYESFPNVLDGNGETDIVDGNGETDIVDGNAVINYHHIYSIGTEEIHTDDVVITGVRVKAMGTKSDYGETVLFGSEGYVLEIDRNELIIEGNAATVANSIGSKIVGMRFRPMEITALANPAIEEGDLAYVTDRKGNTYQTLITSIGYVIGGISNIYCDAKSPARNSSTRYSASTKSIVKAKENTKKELTAYDIAVITLTEAIVNGLGLYQTVSGDEIEGRIIYQHDKPTMEQSVKRWFRTSEGYIQQTRPNTSSAWVTTSGQDIYGNALYNTIITKGLSAEWIIAGIIASANNSSWFDLDANSFSYANGALTYSPANGFRINTPNTTLINGNLTTSSLTATGGNISLQGSDSDDKIRLTNSSDSTRYASYSPTQILMYRNTSLAVQIQNLINGGQIALREVGGSLETQLSYLQVKAQNGNFTNISVPGTKNRIVKTKNYGEVLHYCLESPSPMFADIGSAIISEDGECYIDTESVFAETIDLSCEYYVQLTKCGLGDLYVSDKQPNYFIVSGTPNLKFDWEVKAKQKGYTNERLDPYVEPKESTETNYIQLADEYLQEYERSLLDYEE